MNYWRDNFIKTYSSYICFSDRYCLYKKSLKCAVFTFHFYANFFKIKNLHYLSFYIFVLDYKVNLTPRMNVLFVHQ